MFSVKGMQVQQCTELLVQVFLFPVNVQWSLSENLQLPSSWAAQRCSQWQLKRMNTCSRSIDGNLFDLCGMGPRGLTFTWWGCYGSRQRHKPTQLVHSFLFCFCVCFCRYGPFNCILFRKFSRHFSVFSLCSSGLVSALLVFSTIYPFFYYYESLP